MNTISTASNTQVRIATIGSVDDGKSTLIGRLLFDSRAILSDQLDALEKRAAGEPIDLSLLTDGLEAERDALNAKVAVHEQRHHRLAIGATLLEIGIAIATVAIITRRNLWWLASIAFGVGGSVLAAGAYAGYGLF